MREVGRVQALDAARAVIAMQPTKDCVGCNRCAKGNTGRELLAENAAGAAVGDLVEVEISEKSRLASIAAVFLIPLLFLGAGLLVGSLISEVGMLVLGVSFLILSYTMVWGIGKLLEKKRGFLPVIINIKENTNE